jgi:hypothetical protein
MLTDLTDLIPLFPAMRHRSYGIGPRHR